MPSYISAPHLATLLLAASPPPATPKPLPGSKRSPLSATSSPHPNSSLNPLSFSAANGHSSTPTPTAAPNLADNSSSSASSSTPVSTSTPPPTLAIVDVRDSDHVGGHIRTSLHYPSASLDATMPELVRKLWDNDVVVFHCALSQQRGPRAAKMYEGLRARRWEAGDGGSGAGKGRAERNGVVEKRYGQRNGDEVNGKEEEEEEQGLQKVYILDGGFVKWMEKYGRDPTMTIDFAPDIWVDYF